MPDAGDVERRIVSLLFCDLVGFTSLSEQLDAEDVAIVQTAYFESVRDAVTRHGGTLEKFIGDAAVAVFGVPSAGEHDAEQAVRSGLAVVGAVSQLASRLAIDDHVLQVRVGVNTGEAVVHPRPEPGEAMVTGDVVNTAARLQAAADVNTVLVGPETALAVSAAIELEPAGELELKGKAAPVRVARALAVLPEPERERAMGGLRAPTVGRTGELERLVSALETCEVGAPGRITVVAPPGTGKSRLLEEFGALAFDRGATVLRARIRPDVLSPFRPVAELLAAALARVGVPSTDRRGLLRALSATLGDERADVVASELSTLLGRPHEASQSGDPVVRRGARFSAWSDGLAALAEGAEVWLVEDVHWSDHDLREFVSVAVGGTSRRLVVCSARPVLMESDPEWIMGGDVLALEPLTERATAELVHALAGDALAADVVVRIGERSGGNPLFVEELLRSWASAGLLQRTDEGWRVLRPITDVELPSTVQAVYAAQLDDLPPAARSVVRHASVAGRQFAVAGLTALGRDVADGVASLLRRGLVSGPIPDPLFGASYAFRHALLRDVGYASLSRGERARLHVRMARWLEAAGEERWDEVAEVTGRHYAAALEAAPRLAQSVADDLTRADTAALAARWFERGGDAALGAAAYESAQRLFERALDLTPPGDSLERGRRLIGLASATAFTSDMDAGLRAAEEALGVLRELALAHGGDAEEAREEASRAASLLGTIHAQQLRFADARALADELLAELGDRDDAVVLRLLLVGLRAAAMIGDDAWAEAAPHRTRAVELSRALGDPELEFEVRTWTVWDETDLGAAWADLEKLAQGLGRWRDVAEARRVRTGLALPDELDVVRERAERLASFARAHQLEEAAAWADYYVAEAEFVRGDWDAALAAGLQAVSAGEAASYHRVATRSWFVVCPIAAARGERAILERAAEWYEPRGFPDTPYGRVARAGVDLLLCRFGLAPAPAFDLASFAHSYGEGAGLPSWLESLDLVLAEGLARGDVAGARLCADAWADAGREHPSVTADAAEILRFARLDVADGAQPAALRGKASSLRALERPWPLLKLLSLLAEAGARASGDSAEIRRLAKRLGVPPAS